jgi:hypothetical protein
MKRIVSALCLLIALAVVFLISATERGFAQERVQVKVKRSDVVSGVIVVSILKAGKVADLQCNDGQPGCKALKAGDYWMVQLPKNFGMYDCQNAEIYPGDKELPEEPDPNTRIGAYCLNEK